MKKFLFLTIFIYCSLLNIACSSDIENTNDIKTEKNEPSISLEDQAIIKNYKDRINGLDFNNRELVDKTMKNSLPEIYKIKNDYERKKIEMNIYLSTGMYQEAYILNTKVLKSDYSPANLLIQCELIQLLKMPKQEFEKCHARLARVLKKDLEKTSKDDPEYLYAEWGYLLSMYKSGHKEYKIKLKQFLDSTTDQTMKFQFQSSYEMAVDENR